jgi:hypothetical protein
MRSIRKDRAAPTAPGFLAARSTEIARLDRLAKEAGARPFFAAGSFDRSAIMKAAIAQARADEIVAAWDKYLADLRTAREQSGFEEADRAAHDAVEALHELEGRIPSGLGRRRHRECS